MLLEGRGSAASLCAGGYWPHWGEPCAMQQPGLPSWDEVLASPAPAPGFLAPAPRSALSPCAPAAPGLWGLVADVGEPGSSRTGR